MLSGFREETNPLYYIVVVTTGLWLLSFVVPPVVNRMGVVSEYFMVVFVIWAVMPVAMAFDVGILRQKFALPARYCLPLIILSTVPIVAPLAGGAWILYRARVVAPSDR